MTQRTRSTAGFVQLELLLAGLLGSLLLGVLLAGFLSLQRALIAPRVLVGGQVLPVAPSYAPLPAALRVQQRFQEWLSRSTAVYVFGGSTLQDGLSAPSLVTPALSADDLPFHSFSQTRLPLSAADFAERFPEMLDLGNAGKGAGTFSVLLLAPDAEELRCACLVQVERQELPDSGWVKFEVRLRDMEGQRLQYAFLEPIASGGRQQAAAVHGSYRTAGLAALDEEAPVSLVFPDPWMFSGRGLGALKSLSRFSHFVPVSQR